MIPNPATDELRVEFTLVRRADIEVEILNSTGEIVRHHKVGLCEPGNHSVRWDGRDERGVRCPGGKYFVRVVSGNEHLETSATLMR